MILFIVRRFEAELFCSLSPRTLYFPELFLKLVNIVFKRMQKGFRVLGRHYYPGINLCFRHSGDHAGEVKHKLRPGMSDKNQIGIDSFRLIVSKFKIYLLIFFIFDWLIPAYIFNYNQGK